MSTAEKLREEFAMVRDRRADIITRQVSFSYMQLWLEEGQISYAQIGSTPQEFERIRGEYLDENEFYMMDVPEELSRHLM